MRSYFQIWNNFCIVFRPLNIENNIEIKGKMFDLKSP